MDVDSLLDESAVILDLTETSLERIIHTILNKTLDILDAPLAYEEAMSTLFLPESGNILAKTIQVFKKQNYMLFTPPAYRFPLCFQAIIPYPTCVCEYHLPN